jgi:hypothetical protein
LQKTFGFPAYDFLQVKNNEVVKNA